MTFFSCASPLLLIFLLASLRCQETESPPAEPQPPPTAVQEIQTADTAVKAGDYRKAIKHYTLAIELAPEVVSSYYKRAAAYLATPETFKYALSDLDTVIASQPDSEQALLRRGKLYIDLGNYESAQADFESVLKIKPSNSLASTRLALAKELSHQIFHAKALFENQLWVECKNYLGQIIEKSSESNKARLMRAKCSFKLNDFYATLEDTTKVLKQDQTQLEAYSLRGDSLFQLGQAANSIQVFKECLRSDPDWKPCKNSFKYAKQVSKLIEQIEQNQANKQYQTVAEQLNELLSLDPPTFYKNNIWNTQCSNFLAMKDLDATIQACSKVLEVTGDDFDAYMNRADAKMLKEDWSGALFDYRKAGDLRPRDSRARDGMHNAEKHQKMAARKDYYKVLGVDKAANSRDISKAFRTLAREKHPDKCSFEEKQNCALEFQDINEAYEVLSDEDKKRRYDSGEDLQLPQQHQQQAFRWSSGGFTFSF